MAERSGGDDEWWSSARSGEDPLTAVAVMTRGGDGTWETELDEWWRPADRRGEDQLITVVEMTSGGPVDRSGGRNKNRQIIN